MIYDVILSIFRLLRLFWPLGPKNHVPSVIWDVLSGCVASQDEDDDDDDDDGDDDDCADDDDDDGDGDDDNAG